MRAAHTLIGCVLLALVASGCGSDSSAAAAPSPSASLDAAAASQSPTSEVTTAIVARMKAADGVFGEVPSEPATAFGVGSIAQGDATYAARLRAQGADGGSVQRLTVPATVDATRSVVHFASPGGAAAALADLAKDVPVGSRASRFQVPGGVGYDVRQGQVLVGRTVAYASGDFLLVLGFTATTPPTAGQPTREDLAAAATGWSRRVSQIVG